MSNFPVYLTFHGIGAAPPWVPADERPYWINEATFINIIAQMAKAAQRLHVELVATFDDGNRSDLEIAAPVLKAQGVRGMFFPCAARIGQAGYLDGSDLRSLREAGFTVGSHGVDHLPWATLVGKDLYRETAEAKITLEAALGAEITDAALPFGSYNRRTLVALKAAGFERVFSSDPGLSLRDAWFVRRFSYRMDRIFDLDEMVATHSSAPKQMLTEIKHRIKALR